MSEPSKEACRSHDHGKPSHGSTDRSFAIAFFANIIFAIVELVGGVLTQSLAITADAVHDFGDSLAIGFAWALERYSKKTSNERFNFGHRRFSLLAALFSGLVIAGGAIAIAVTGITRFWEPREPVSLGMAGLAIFGILVNGIGASALGAGKHAHHNHNQEMMKWHLLEDLFGWIVVLVGAIVIHFTKWTWIDPLLAVGLSAFILWNVSKNLKETLYLLMQGRPKTFDETHFAREILSIDGIREIAAIQIWSLDGSNHVMSLKLRLSPSASGETVTPNPSLIETIKTSVRKIGGKFSIAADNLTIEILN